MGPAWDSIQLNLEDESVVVVPSISIERTTASSSTVMQAMEERALFLLLLLRQPRLRMIYVTSQPVSEAIIEYYLGLLPGVIPSHARARLILVPVGDASSDTAEHQAVGPATASPGDPVADPEPGAQPPHSLQHHTARAGCRAVAWHSDVRCGPSSCRPRYQDRLPQDVRGMRGALSGGSGGTCAPPTTSWPVCRRCAGDSRRCA